MNEITIRPETHADYEQIGFLIKEAFKEEPHSDHTEQLLVHGLRNSPAFIPQLALVAQLADRIVGYILLTKIQIITHGEQQLESLALAPVAVLPSFQNKGIGSALIRHAHRIARELGYSSIAVVGHQNYYPRFGYKTGAQYGIEFPFDVPAENCMMLELGHGSLADVGGGRLQYPTAFYSNQTDSR